MKNVYEKLQVHSKSEAVAKALRDRLDADVVIEDAYGNPIDETPVIEVAPTDGIVIAGDGNGNMNKATLQRAASAAARGNSVQKTAAVSRSLTDMELGSHHCCGFNV